MTKAKFFMIAGTSNLYGKVKFRFANGTVKHRTGVMARFGHKDINFLELPRPMTKDEARDYVKANLDAALLPAEKPAKVKKERKAKAAVTPDYGKTEDQVSETDLQAEKLAEKRAKDAARKRLKRAQAKAAAQAVAA